MTDSKFDGLDPAAIAEIVEEIWRDLLMVPLGEDDATFFELGGESISAVRIVARVSDALGVEVDVAELFNEDPNLADFIRMVTERAAPPAAA